MSRAIRPDFLYWRTTLGDAVEAYYGYLEARDLDVRGPIVGPSSAPAPRGFPILDGLSRRLRLSVIRVPDFVRIAPQFEDIPVTGASDDQRGRRRRALIEHLGPTPLEVMDIHAPPRPQSQRLLQAPAVGGWCCVALGDETRMEGRLPVLIGDPDEDGEDRLRSLLFVRHVREREFAALRRVFSLAHIGDLDDGGGGAAGPTIGRVPPQPEWGKDPTDGVEPQHIHIMRVAAAPVEKSETRQAVDYGLWEATPDEDLQYVRLTEG